MKFLCSEKISAHKYKTPEGYLVCVDSVLARTGKQTYKRSEIFGCDCKDAENEVEIDRPAEEVFSDKTLASFENKPLTIEHPDEDVNTSNHRDLAVGFARDIKRGKDNGQDVMLGTLVFTDEDAIEAIENGDMVELSCGYDADIIDEENPCQRNIRGNHIALCQRGRAGNARIVDSKVRDDYHQIDMTDPWGGTRSLIVRANSFEEAKKKAEQFKPEWKFRAAWQASKDDVDSAKRRGLYVDSIKDDALQKGKTYVAKSGATLKVVDYECSFSDYNGEASVIITYDYVSASGKKSGRAKANAHDFWKMLTDKSLTGDSVKDDLELPEDEDSSFMYRDAYGKEIIVTNWDGRNMFLVEHDGTERQMSRRDVEYYLDRKGARFSRVLKDSVKDNASDLSGLYKNNDNDAIKVTRNGFSYDVRFGEDSIFNKGWSHSQSYDRGHLLNYLRQNRLTKVTKFDYLKDSVKVEPGMERYYDSVKDGKIAEIENGKKLVQVGKTGAHYAEYNHGYWHIMHKGKLISTHNTKEEAKRILEEYAMRDSVKDGLVKTTNPEIHAWKERGKYRTQAYNRNKLDYASLQDIARKHSVVIKESSYGYVDIISDDKSKIYKAFSEINPSISVGSWSIIDSVKDADFSKQSKQGYQVVEMYRDAGRLHAILKRSNDYVIAYGYDTSDGTWAQGRYDFTTLERARQVLQEEKKYARRIADVDTYEEANEGLKQQAKEISDSKEDILQKLRTVRIPEGDTFEMRDGQYLVQIQNVGKDTIEIRKTGSASVKTSSWAWGRIWKNGTILFNETDAVNIIRDKMIQFLKTVRDSKRR